MKKLKDENLLINIIIYILFFLSFLYISRYAPVAGDDWGYAVGGRNAHALLKAYENYMHWSGRFLSEFWGFSIAPHKHLWNVLNASLFTGILYAMMQIVQEQKHELFTLLLAVMLMISVHTGVRMQTYTWIMGTTYIVPLCLFLIYLYFIKEFVFRKQQSKRMIYGCYILNLCIPLYMENAAAMLFGVNLLILLYLQFHDQRIRKQVFKFTICSLIGLLLIRFSPGAIFRMNRDHVAFNELSLFEKINLNWMNFLNWTFINHQVLIRTMSIVLMYVVYRKKNEFKRYKNEWFVLELALVYPLIQSYAYNLFEMTHANIFYIIFDLNVPHSVQINTIMFTLFTLCLFRIANGMSEEVKWFSILCLFAAGGANAVMLISPIFDARSSIYTIYMCILYVLVILKDTKLPKVQNTIGLIAVLIVNIHYANVYFNTYRMIHAVDLKRMQQIEYYQKRPDVKEAYILGYPPMSVHSADIQKEDTYHMEFFKKYYYLNENMDLNFYYLDDYSIDSIYQAK